MKTLSKLRFILLLVLCAVGGKGWAEGDVIFSEDFGELPEFLTYFSEYTNPVYGTWTFNERTGVSGLKRVDGVDKGLTLKLENSSNGIIPGKATTPALANLDGNATLTFMYANGSANSVHFDLTIEGDGTFDNGEKKKSYVCPNGQTSKYVEVNENIIGGKPTTKLSFTLTTSVTLYLADILIVSASPIELALAQDLSNAETLTANAGKLANVTIGRTFPANTWCTLCLPFDVTTEMVREACNQTEDPKLRVFSSVEDQTLKFTAPSNGTVPASTPFLLNLATAVTSSPVFSNVTISKTDNDVTPAATVTYSDCSFTGTYSPKEIDTNEATADLFLNSSGQFCRPTTEGGKTLAGLRAYITVPVNVASGARMKLSIENDDMATGIETLTLSPSHDGTLYTPGIGVNSTATVYTLTGHTAAKRTAKGISIVRSQDGRVRKTVTK